MEDVSRFLADVQSAKESEQLLPLVYDELRRLAAARLDKESAGQTLDATALVHEAYLRLLGPTGKAPTSWEGRGHFFAAAAEAMRRIMVDRARRKARLRHGGGRRRVELAGAQPARDQSMPLADLLAVHEALEEFELVDEQAARIVKMHYFLGLPFQEIAELTGVSERTAYRNWSYARAWLYDRLRSDE